MMNNNNTEQLVQPTSQKGLLSRVDFKTILLVMALIMGGGSTADRLIFSTASGSPTNSDISVKIQTDVAVIKSDLVRLKTDLSDMREERQRSVGKITKAIMDLKLGIAKKSGE